MTRPEITRVETGSGFVRLKLDEIIKHNKEEAGSNAALIEVRIEQSQAMQSLYIQGRLLQPPVTLSFLREIVAESGILPQCIEVLEKNEGGLGFDIIKTEKAPGELSAEDKARQSALYAFFSKINETESMVDLRRKFRIDIEEVGNAFLEVVNDTEGIPSFCYYLDPVYMRVGPLGEEAINIPVTISRGGHDVTVNVRKYFRKYAMIVPTAGILSSGASNVTDAKTVWFKEFGDPRLMNPLTGEYYKEGEDGGVLASSVIHFKGPRELNGYGLPRWYGLAFVVKGLSNADYVNYDLFENNGIPPFFITVSGGALTKETYDQFIKLMDARKGLVNFNKGLVLESAPVQSGIEGDTKGGARIEIKTFDEARKSDALFSEYTAKGEKRVRTLYRISPIFLGLSEDYNRATAYAGMQVSEKQVFSFMRNDIDQIINGKLLMELEKDPRLPGTAGFFAYKSRGIDLGIEDEVTTNIEMFIKYGILTFRLAAELAEKILSIDIDIPEEDWVDKPLIEVWKEATGSIPEDNNTSKQVAAKMGELVTAVRRSFGLKQDSTAADLGKLGLNVDEIALYQALLGLEQVGKKFLDLDAEG
jgi:PBSX family phage portal protein